MIGSRIRQARLDRGLTRYEVAGLCGIHPQSLDRYESERATPGPDALQRLAIALRVSADWLLEMPGSSLDVPPDGE